MKGVNLYSPEHLTAKDSMTALDHTTHNERSYVSSLQHAKCCLCNGSQSKEILLSKDYNWGIPGLFRYVKCNRCGLIYEDPRPTPDKIMGLYPPFYGTAVRNPSENPQSKINVPVHHIHRKIIERFIPKTSRSIFDIGCGSGFFLEYMRRRGWRVSGIDPSAEHVIYANRYLGLQDVHKGRWPIDHEPTNDVNVVSLFHVIEHLPSPIAALIAIDQILRPGGIVVMETPNVKSWPAKVFGPRWVTLDAPRHLNLFSKRTLRYCLNKAGFEVLMLKSFSPSTMEYSESIRYLLQDLGLRKYAKTPSESTEKTRGHGDDRVKDPYHKAENAAKKWLHKSEMAIFSTLNSFSDLFDAGCNLLVVAQKPSTQKQARQFDESYANPS